MKRGVARRQFSRRPGRGGYRGSGFMERERYR